MSDTLLRIRMFVAVYEERSFTAAAARENATQSGVTQHVRKLEDQLGVALFLRRSGSVQTTPAGDAYYQACIQVLRAHEEARQAVRTFGGSLAGEVVVGLTPTMTRAALAPALAAFVAAHPNVVVRVIDAYSDIVVDKVRAGEVDFGIVPGQHHAAGMRSELFARTAELLVSGPRANLGLPNGLPADLRLLGPLKIVLPSKAQARRSALENYFTSHGVHIERRLEIDTSLGAFDFVARTDWVSIHPAIMMAGNTAGYTVNPLSPPLVLELYRIERTRQPLSPAALAFFDILQETAAALTSDAPAARAISPSEA